MKKTTAGLGSLLFLVGCQSSADQHPRSVAEVPIATTPAAVQPTAAVDPVAPSTTSASTGDAKSVAESTWNFCSSSDGSTSSVTFHAGGALDYSKFHCTQAGWKQSGARVTFDCNNFTVFEAVITAPDKMGGTWHRTAKPDETFPTCLVRSVGF